MITTTGQFANSRLLQHTLSAQQFEKLFEPLTLLVFAADLNGRLVYLNQNAELILGYTADELIGTPLLQVVHKNYHEKLEAILRLSGSGSVSGNIEAWLQRKNGNTFPGSWTLLWDVAENLFYGTVKDITEQKAKASLQELHKQRLKDKNRQIDEMLERIQDGFFAMDDEWRISYANTRAELIMKMPRSEVLGKYVWDVFPHLEGGRFQSECMNAIVHQQPVQFINYEESLDIWFNNRIYPSDNGISIFFQNISAQKKAEEEIRVSNERFRLAAKSNAIYDWNILSDHLQWGEGLYDLLGYYSNELQMVNWEAFLHPDEREDVVQHLYATINDQYATSWEAEYLILKKDNTYSCVLEKSQIVRNEDGKAIRMVGFLQDVSERKRAEEKLHQLSLIAQQTNNLVIITDETGRVTWVNDAFIRVTGFTCQEIAGRKPGHLLQGPESDPKVIQYMREKIANGESFMVETINYTKSKEKFWVENYCQPVRDSKGKLVQFFAIQTNISDRKKLEAELQSQQKRIHAAVIAAQEKERAAVGQELHDNVNQVLTTVKLYTELCRDGIGNTYEVMNKSIKLLQESIDEIRSLSRRLSAPSLGSIKLKESVKELIDSVMATNKVLLYFDTFNIEGLVVDNELHLCIYRILQEHLTNILKHAAAREVHILLREKDDEILLQINDDGKGFDPSKKRSGIGLTNMTTRAESLKGTLSIMSAPGLGCQLMVRLPLLQ